ncbi:MAG: hypothetical protein RLZ62_596 [Bacteroidota bacterium]|jgi:hypothetical protein
MLLRFSRSGIIPYTLLALILFQGAGWMLAWQAMQVNAKIRAEKAVTRLENSSLHLTLSIGLFQRVRVDRKEIRLDGNMYDIRSALFTRDSVHLELYHDKREQALFALLEPHISFLADYSAAQASPVAVWAAQWLVTSFVVPDRPVPFFLLEQDRTDCFHWFRYCPEAPSAGLFQPPRA